jgi:ORF6N domain
MEKTMTKPGGRSDVRIERIESAILFVRGDKVMLDHDLGKLYEVPTKVLNQAVKRNQERFPSTSCFS